MVIYMDQYRKAQTINKAGVYHHAVEQLCVNGNPAMSMAAPQGDLGSRELSPQLPEDFSTVDIGAFYNRVYALASQI